MKIAKNCNEIAKKALADISFEDGGNIVVSPVSILMLLAILAEATKGKAHQEIMNLIAKGLSEKNFPKTIAKMQWWLAFTLIGQENFVCANALYVKESLKDSIVPEFEKKLANYGGKLFASENCARDINKWVSKSTKGMIKKIIENPIDPLFIAALMNAAAFQAVWHRLYWDENVFEEKFNNADGTISIVNMMKSKEDFYVEDDFFKGFIKPYNSCGYSFMALLPKKKGKKAFVEALHNIDFVKLFKERGRCIVHTKMPEFKCDYEVNLEDFCKDSGISTIFSEKADFSPFCKENILISEILHKAHIEVDRIGTRAAALTYCGKKGALPVDYSKPKFVRLNRPFVYAIIHEETEIPVFAGTVGHIDSIESLKKEDGDE